MITDINILDLEKTYTYADYLTWSLKKGWNYLEDKFLVWVQLQTLFIKEFLENWLEFMAKTQQ